MLERDKLVFIRALKSQAQIHWEVHPLVEQIKIYLSFFTQVVIQHTYRERNQVTDQLMKFDLTIFSFVWRMSISCFSFSFCIFIENKIGRIIKKRATKSSDYSPFSPKKQRCNTHSLLLYLSFQHVHTPCLNNTIQSFFLGRNFNTHYYLFFYLHVLFKNNYYFFFSLLIPSHSPFISFYSYSYLIHLSLI